MSALFAFLHHLTAFVLVAMLAVELVLLREELTMERARQLLRIDQIYGVSAGLLLAISAVRVFWLEKGASYYFHSVPFIIKLCLFLSVGLLSIYPTREFLSWRKPLQQGQRPRLEPDKQRSLRRVMHIQLLGVVLILLCAALAARGIGYLG